MAEKITSFMQRPFFVGATMGHPDGFGARAGLLLPSRPEPVLLPTFNLSVGYSF